MDSREKALEISRAQTDLILVRYLTHSHEYKTVIQRAVKLLREYEDLITS